MNKERLNRIQTDRQRASTVIYLEGKTDEPILMALAGITRPSSGIHNDVYVVGLRSGGHGGNEVRALVETAVEHDLGGLPGQGGVFGIVDGDGRGLSELKAHFEAPYAGPLFSLPTYCIENLLSIAWPAAWGPLPDWVTVLSSYIPYAALNRVHIHLQSALRTLQLEKFHSPTSGQALKTLQDVKAALAADKNLVTDCDVEAMFDKEVVRIADAIQSSTDEAHALINGKWLLNHYAKERQPGRPVEALREEWAKHIQSAGGHPKVRKMWTHIAGVAP